ncbi:MAG: hypothetical protein ACREM6_16465, partial [Vulcanimicrobiaceae bacterium]
HRQHGGTLTLEAGPDTSSTSAASGSRATSIPKPRSHSTNPTSAASAGRVPYPIARTQGKITRTELPTTLADRLGSGR